MASLVLSVVGTAIGGPIGGAIGSAIGGLIDNVLFPAKKQAMPPITASTYGNAIPIAYGPKNRLGGNLIWSSGFRKVSNKSLKYLAGKGGSSAQAQTYVADLALAIGEGPWEAGWLKKVWANSTVIFDATASVSAPPAPDAQGVVTWDLSYETFQDFDTIVVYPGNLTQLPDPTIEAALGVGNVPAYRGTAYIVINSLKLTTFGNAVPTINVLVEAAGTVTLAEICTDICQRAGLDVNTVSTSSLNDTVLGYSIGSQTDAASAIQPLALCFNFDAAEVAGNLRFVPRGLPSLCCIENVRLAGHAYGDAQPDAFQWPRDPETTMPKLAALTFIDPDRDCQANTQSAQRLTGSAQSNLSENVTITMTTDQARAICDRMLWEAQIGRQAFAAAVSERLIFMEPGRSFAIESPAGFEQVRITKAARGINGVIEIEGKRDFTPLYFSTAPGAAAASQDNFLTIGGPVNPPLFIEPPSNFPGVTGATLLIAVSGGDGVTANPSWNGCDVYASTDDSNFTLVGQVVAPAIMGVLTADCPSYGGSNPDTTTLLDVSTEMSGQEPPTISFDDAQNATAPYYVGGEFLSAETVTGLGGSDYQLTNLWRGLYSTDAGAHARGTAFARLDAAVFRFPMPQAYIGKTVHFRFVGGGETLASVVDYTYTGKGSGFGTGVGGVPAAGAGLAGTPGVQGATISWNPAPQADNLTSTDIYRADGLGASFSDATLIGTAGAGQTTYTDLSAAPGAPYTYFVVPVNIVGPGANSGGLDITTAPGDLGPQFATVVAGEDIAAVKLVTFSSSGGFKADNTDATKPADGFVLQAYMTGETMQVFLSGQVIPGLSLVEGDQYWLGTDGDVVNTRPNPPSAAQDVGKAVDSSHLSFVRGPMVDQS